MLAAMKIYEGSNKDGEITYLEVPNTFLSRKGVLSIIKKIPGAQDILFQSGDVFCTFELNGKKFEVLEPFNDSSRFHIGEKEAKPSNELETH